jgi:putative ABC transport system permease protein
VLAIQAMEYALLSAIVGLVALVLGAGGGWFVVTRVFQFEWLPGWAVILTTLVTGALATVLIGVAGSLPVLRSRPSAALRAL